VGKFYSLKASEADAFSATAGILALFDLKGMRDRGGESGPGGGFFNTGVSMYAAPNRGLSERTQRRGVLPVSANRLLRRPDTERGTAWPATDSLSLRKFLGYALDEATPDHSTISRTRRLFWLERHQAVFRWVMKIPGKEGLISGRTVSIDATTREANAP
jgi:hypothetical protein